MKKMTALLCTSLALAACNGPTALDDNFANPLYAEWYYQDLVDDMVNVVLAKDPLLEDESKKSIVDDTRRDALKLQKEAENRQLEGAAGYFVSNISSTRGEALFVDDTVYLGPDFDTVPGPDQHLYLTTMIDPREGNSFPDESAIHLGKLKDAYGPQAYAVAEHDETLSYRTIVLWDTKLERMYGFVQLQAR